MKYKHDKSTLKTEEPWTDITEKITILKKFEGQRRYAIWIYTIEIGEDDFESILDAEWFCTEEERDFVSKKYVNKTEGF